MLVEYAMATGRQYKLLANVVSGVPAVDMLANGTQADVPGGSKPASTPAPQAPNRQAAAPRPRTWTEYVARAQEPQVQKPGVVRERPLRVQKQRFFAPETDRGLLSWVSSNGAVPNKELIKAIVPNFGLVQVTGDGNCGFYALLAGLVYHAVDFHRFRGHIVQRLREIGAETNDLTAAFGRIQNELNYNNAKASNALAYGKLALRALAEVIEKHPQHAVRRMEADARSFEHACYVLRAVAIRDHNCEGAALDHYASTHTDLGPMAETFGVQLVVPTVDPSADAAWTPQALKELAATHYEPGNIHLLHSYNHFDLLLPMK